MHHKYNNVCRGGGVLLHLLPNNSCKIKIKMGLGHGMNKYVELMALKLLLLFAEKNE
jgi:hypothetical protein